MKKHILILNDSSTKITVHTEYLEISDSSNKYTIAFRYIKAVYINKAANVDIGSCYKICCHVPLWLIDQHGYIIAKLSETEDAQI